MPSRSSSARVVLSRMAVFPSSRALPLNATTFMDASFAGQDEREPIRPSRACKSVCRDPSERVIVLSARRVNPGGEVGRIDRVFVWRRETPWRVQKRAFVTTGTMGIWTSARLPQCIGMRDFRCFGPRIHTRRTAFAGSTKRRYNFWRSRLVGVRCLTVSSARWRILTRPTCGAIFGERKIGKEISRLRAHGRGCGPIPLGPRYSRIPDITLTHVLSHRGRGAHLAVPSPRCGRGTG